MVRDIGRGDGSVSPKNFTLVGDRALFTVADGVHGDELWVTDGSTEGTHLLRGINPGAAGSAISGMTDGTVQLTDRPVGHDMISLDEDKWLYTAFASSLEYEYSLFATSKDGDQTLITLDQHTIGGRYSGEVRLTVLGEGKAIIQSAEDLFVTDGTPDGTKIIHTRLTIHAMTDFVSLGDGRALFMNRDASQGGVTAADLWVTDGAEAGTYQIARMSNENPTSLLDHVQDLGDGRFAFAAPIEGHAGAVWVTNPSASSLERNPTINSWSGYSVFMPIVVVELPVEPPVEPPPSSPACWWMPASTCPTMRMCNWRGAMP
ncbi:hypothetical protein [Teichococcus rhizosphaerae]|nr:hypothetical protein [Pseudoroseomonas rhizosphaerae]